jgi:predicted ATPase/DNA-binding winged helix-turn-helix (wHTH) protein
MRHSDRAAGAEPAGPEIETSHAEYQFGPFRLLPARHVLLHDDKPVTLGARAFDILTLLVARAGEVVSKADLVAHTWPNSFVHEDNLKVNVANVRRNLAEHDRDGDYITTVSGRGYMFVAAVERVANSAPHPAQPGPKAISAPPNVRPLYGRDEALKAIFEKMKLPGYVTLAGLGGVGKTSLAITAARAMCGGNADGIAFVDLSTIADPRFVVPALASALGVSLALDDPLAGVINALRQTGNLLIVDNCEHVSAMAAAAIDRIASELPSARLIATSREPLRTRNEQIYFLSGLAHPSGDRDISAAEAMTSPAVQLFIARAKAAGTFALTDENAGSVASICARLDGLALAIELAASKAAIFTPSDLDAVLADGMHRLGLGPRDAPLRHQTLEATLDWSYRLLSETEAVLLRLLSVFSGRFTAEDAGALFPAAGLDPRTASDALSQLVAKSLVSADYDSDTVRYRLAESTRSYARQRLDAAPERDRAKRHFATRMRSTFEAAERQWSIETSRKWLMNNNGRIDDLRAAIGWAFSPSGDSQIGVDLVVAALPLWQEISAFAEMLAAIDSALAASDDVDGNGGLAQVKLANARAWAMTLSTNLAPETEVAWQKCLRYAVQADDADHWLRAVGGQAVYLAHSGRPRQALAALNRFGARPGFGWSSAPDGERLLAHIEVYAGRLGSASNRLEALAKAWSEPGGRPALSRFQLDLPVAIRMSLSLLLWLTGESERASSIAADAVSRAADLGHLVTEGHAIALGALPVAYLSGDFDTASRLQTQLEQICARANISLLPGTSGFFAGAIDVAQGRMNGIARMQDSISALATGDWLTLTAFYRCVTSEALISIGELTQAEICLRQALSDPRLREERWCHSELLRVSGILRAHQGDSAQARSLFDRAKRSARRIGAVALEARADQALLIVS